MKNSIIFLFLVGCSNYRPECLKGCPDAQPTPNATTQVVYTPVQGTPGTNGKDGTNGTNGATGQNGKDGQQGLDGKDGASGPSGMDGGTGQNGKDATGYTVVLCGSTQPHAEIAIYMGGYWVAYFNNPDGSNPRLTRLVPGFTYVSTDGIQTCTFTTEDLNREIGATNV